MYMNTRIYIYIYTHIYLRRNFCSEGTNEVYCIKLDINMKRVAERFYLYCFKRRIYKAKQSEKAAVYISEIANFFHPKSHSLSEWNKKGSFSIMKKKTGVDRNLFLVLKREREREREREKTRADTKAVADPDCQS